VEKYEILEERPGKDRYAVKLRAWVQLGDSTSPRVTKALLSQRGFIVLGTGDGADIVVGLLKVALLERKLSAYDESFVRGSYTSAGRRFPSQVGTSLDLAGRFLADYVIRVQTHVSLISSTYGIQVYQTRVEIHATEVSSGLLKAFAEVSNRVFGLSKGQALEGQRPDQLRAAVAEPAVAKVLGELDDLAIGRPRPIRVTLDAPTSSADLDRLANAVNEMRWVERCEKAAYSSEQAVLIVAYPEKPVYLAADIDYLPGYAVSSYGPGYVVVVAEKGQRDR
jgi:hypothetical protein